MGYRIGCSGWSYPHWRDVFYPHGLRQADWFQHYSSVFDTVEINNSFYRTPSEENFQTWARKAPEGFLYAVKVNRAITQYHKLNPLAYPLFAEFVRRSERMEAALGPLLLQLPPSLGRDDGRLAAFLEQPIAARHPLAIEFRHAGWFAEEVYDLLRKHRVALVLSDFKELPIPQVATTHWVYLRLHGTSGRYFGSYGDEGLRYWADRLKALCPDGYVYFNNDVGGAAPHDALRLRDLLSK
ncbi:MAG: DUF72 domain-containing protein [Chloroflexi bacterium]|nr:DUF72 domain-containing protein [Chloroflexota bacterium]